MTEEVQKETRGFESEVKQLLDLVIHSLYSNKEVFLRELVSNASDAADKLRFAALSDDSLYEDEPELKIEVDFSESQNSITIRDNGIGMSYEEVIENLGTIAKSGTREFFKALTGDAQSDAQLIGQFGVGFYSAFTVAERVTVRSRKAGLAQDEGVFWESEGKGEYDIQPLAKKRRGTEVVLHLREDEKALANGYTLRGLIRKYSDHIGLPIEMPVEGEDATGFETVNSATALWTRNKKDVSDEEYGEFYNHIAHDFEPPLAWAHNKVEGKLEYTTLLFVPKHAPFDMWDREAKHGVKLYVRRVFIMDDAEQLLPRYLRFVRGIVDSNDLPLNVSREILQHDKASDTIRQASTKRILSLLEDLADNRADDYTVVWKEFGRVLKEGAIEDVGNKERIANLMRFASTHDEDNETVSLQAYVGRMPEAQKYIYYLVAENLTTASASPHLEIFTAKGVEVLLLGDAVDEWMVPHLDEFEGKTFKSVTRGDLELGDLGEDDKSDDADSPEADPAEHAELTKRIKEVLEEKVKDVRVTQRLTSSPACLIADEDDMGMNLQRILQAAGQDMPSSKPILEINATHPIVLKLAGPDAEAQFSDWVEILFDQAVLSEGGKLENPARFVQRLNQMFLEISS